MLEDFFRAQNKAKYLQHKTDKLLDNRIRMAVTNCIVDFMVDAFGKGDPMKISKQQRQLTAQAAVKLFVGLKSDIGNESVNIVFLRFYLYFSQLMC